MQILYLLLQVLILYFALVVGKDDNDNSANVENLKTLRKSVNFAYKAGNNFLDLIRGSTPPHVSVQLAKKTFSKREGITLSELFPIYLPYAGFISLGLIGLLFFIFVPIVGFCFCCCRCAGKCGGKIKGMDSKHATCKRYTYALFLGIISIVQLGGIVLAFINNQLVHDTLTSPSVEISAIKQLSVGAALLRSSLKNITEAIKEGDKLTGINADFEINNTDFMEATCSGYFSVLQNESDHSSITNNLTKISSKLDDSVSYLGNVKQNNENLETYSTNFKKEIDNLQLTKFRHKVCKMLSDVVLIDFDDLKGIMRRQIKLGSSAGRKLQYVVNFYNSYILSTLDASIKAFHENVKVEYLEYRMYVCIGVCCLLLLIVLFYFLGLCFGQCGERPFEDARICNRGVGANLMMAGVAFAFLFTPMIMLFETMLFYNFGLAQTDLCSRMTSPDPQAIRTFDSIIYTMNELNPSPYIRNNSFDSVFNKCPKMSMAVAFNIDDDLMSPEIKQKIIDIGTKVQKMSNIVKTRIVDEYFNTIEGLLSNISSEIGFSRGKYDNFDTDTKNIIIEKLTSVTTEISDFSLATVKEKFKNCFNNAANKGFGPALKSESRKVLSKIYLSSYENVRCDGLSQSARKIVDAACVTFLWPFNGFWYGVGICLIFTIPAIIFAVKLAGLYRRTEKYSADYEEPDYHSYMGFYTNNADNIPMKRPKSAKSNQKNRNSNSNNKESVKQNNPQYLPVYPYDAYE